MDFFTHYLAYSEGTEPPKIFHRWSAIVGIGALLERNAWLYHGDTRINPNMYVMLMGDPGTRKSSAVKQIARLIKQTGYSHFAAQRTTKEKWLSDLAASNAEIEGIDDITTMALFGTDADPDAYTPNFVAADEANEFFGLSNNEFLGILGSLWDINEPYENKTKTSKSDWIPSPVISILSGNTPTNFTLAFPPTILGSGFFSRLILIHGEKSGRKYTFPIRHSLTETESIVSYLSEVKAACTGELSVTDGAHKLLDKIYQRPERSIDARFASYHNRRFTHLLKLAISVAAANYTGIVGEDIVLEANTYLTHAERQMPKALGEFGQAKNSGVTNQVLGMIGEAKMPVTVGEIWSQVSQNLEDIQALVKIMHKLLQAGKIQQIPDRGYLPIKEVALTDMTHIAPDDTVAYADFLTPEELGIKT